MNKMVYRRLKHIDKTAWEHNFMRFRILGKKVIKILKLG